LEALREAADAFRGKTLQRLGVEKGRSVRTLRFAVGIVGIRGKAEAESAVYRLRRPE